MKMKMKMKRLTLLVALSLVLCCALAAAPALATESTPAADCTTSDIAATSTDESGLPQPAIAQAPDTVDAAAGCDAQALCQNGLSVTCSASGPSASCSGVDANCSISRRGSVTCNGSTTYCPLCQAEPPSCWVQGAPCSTSGYCDAKCNAYCDGSTGGFCTGNGTCECYLVIE